MINYSIPLLICVQTVIGTTITTVALRDWFVDTTTVLSFTRLVNKLAFEKDPTAASVSLARVCVLCGVCRSAGLLIRHLHLGSNSVS